VRALDNQCGVWSIEQRPEAPSGLGGRCAYRSGRGRWIDLEYRAHGSKGAHAGRRESHSAQDLREVPRKLAKRDSSIEDAFDEPKACFHRSRSRLLVCARTPGFGQMALELSQDVYAGLLIKQHRRSPVPEGVTP